MVKNTTLQGSAADFNDDQDHGCCAVFKKLFKKQNTAVQSSHSNPLARPATLPTNQEKRVAPDVNPAPGTKEEPDVNPTPGIQEELQATTTPEDSPLPKDEDPSQTSREDKANAKFRKAKEQLENVISKPNAVSSIELSFLKSSDIGNVSQMARDIELAISEFMKERDKQNEAQKGKGIAKS
jgi:hypothetical protein